MSSGRGMQNHSLLRGAAAVERRDENPVDAGVMAGSTVESDLPLRDQSTSMRSAQLLDRLVTNFANDYRFATFHGLPLSLTSRLGYLPRKYAAILQNRRQVRFLGKPFRYDNRLMPALLQAYPDEIAALDRHVDFARAVRVMDVGANVGQFGFVLKTF